MDRVSCGAEHGMHWARGSSCFKRGKSFQLKEEEEEEVEKKKESGCFKWCPEPGLAQVIITDLMNIQSL